MSDTFEKTGDSTTGKYGVVFKNAVNQGYQMDPNVFDSEADAEKAAEDHVSAGAVDAQVLVSSGPRFTNLE